MRILYAVLFLSLILVGLVNAQKAEKTHLTSQSSDAGLIMLNVTVTDKSDRIAVGLDKPAFTVYDNNVPQEITFFDNKDVPLSVAIIYDMSGSMAPVRADEGKIREIIKTGLVRFIQSSNASNEYFLIGFNQKVELLSDWTEDGNAILGKITDKRLKGQTALYDACYTGVDKLMREAHQKRAVLLISDGQDTNSSHTLSELRHLLKESDVLVYTIGVVVNYQPGSQLEAAGLNDLDDLASETGGRLHVPKTSADLNKIFELIALELRHQYTVGYKPMNFTDDEKWHRIKIKIKPPPNSSGKVPNQLGRSRKGYFANSRLLKRISD